MKTVDKDATVKVTRDKLYIGIEEAPSLFECNTLPLPSSELAGRKYRDMSHTPVKVIKGSTFQGHAASIHTIEEAAQARDALFQDVEVSTADSIMYAYRIFDENHQLISGFSDDREWLGGSSLDKLLEEEKQDGIFIALSRHHNGPNLGPKRFDYIKAVAKAAINREFLLATELNDSTDGLNTSSVVETQD